jgi:hypothetical protein
MATAIHHPGCDPREQTATSCPCGVTDSRSEWEEANLDEAIDHLERLREEWWAEQGHVDAYQARVRELRDELEQERTR